MSFSATIEKNIINDLFEALDNGSLVLPSLPDVAQKIQNVLDSKNCSSTKITAAIETDVALSARLIQIANSPLIRGKNKIDSIEMAVTRMGNTMINNVVTGLTLQQIFKPKTEVIEKRLAVHWEHSNQIAALCHSLATTVHLKADKALLAGLIHNIGALPILMQAENISILLEDSELLDKIISHAHGTIGTAMLEKWDFPDDLINIPTHHLQLNREHSGPANYVDLVIVANLKSYHNTSHQYASVEWDTVPAFAKLGLINETSQTETEDPRESFDGILDALLM